jgi:hypothetical protein
MRVLDVSDVLGALRLLQLLGTETRKPRSVEGL